MGNDDEPAPPAPSGHGEALDDSPLSHAVRWFDDNLGKGERVILFLLFIVLVTVGLYQVFVDLLYKKHPLWAIEVSRDTAFAIGLLGAAYATQNKRNFGLDLVSVLMTRKIKAVIRVFTNLAAMFAAMLLFYGGRLLQAVLRKEPPHHQLVPTWVVAWFIPLASALIIIHVVCHIIIEVDYLRRGKTAPEPEVVG